MPLISIYCDLNQFQKSRNFEFWIQLFSHPDFVHHLDIKIWYTLRDYFQKKLFYLREKIHHLSLWYVVFKTSYLIGFIFIYFILFYLLNHWVKTDKHLATIYRNLLVAVTFVEWDAVSLGVLQLSEFRISKKPSECNDKYSWTSIPELLLYHKIFVTVNRWLFSHY